MENYVPVVPGLKEAAAHAINNNDWTPVRTLLEDTIAKDSVGYTQLQQIHVDDNIIKKACNGGFTELVSVFLNSGFPVNCVVDKSFGERMLHFAACRGHLFLVKLLINLGADIDCEDCESTTPLYYAVQRGNLEVVKHLINAGADITCDKDGKTLLNAAYLYRKVTEEMLQLLLDSGCDPNICHPCDPLYCPLYWEVMSNNIKHVKILLDAGAHVSGTYTYEPLHLAANWGFIPIMELLLKYGADINITDSGGNTALHRAVKKIQSVKFLIEHGSLINSVNNSKQTPLALSFQYRQFDVAMLLINSGADLNLPIHDTVLHTAVRGSAPIHVIECLLEHGASVTAVDYNETALQCVISYRNLSNDWKLHVAKLLLIYGSSHYLEDKYGNTVLHWACEMGDVELVEYFIYYGLNVDAKNTEGKKPIDIAHETGHPAIINIIIENHCNKYSI